VLIFTQFGEGLAQNTRDKLLDLPPLDRQTHQGRWRRQALNPDVRETLPTAPASVTVRENNLFVEPVEGSSATKLTTDGSASDQTAPFDWVYEEEFSCRDGWRWSEDGKQIAYWQLDTRGVKTFTLIDNTTQTYPILEDVRLTPRRESELGMPSRGRRRVRGPTRWIDVPGDTRTDCYIPRVEWAGNSRELAIQRVNRLQNAVDVMLADASTGKVRKVLTERDGAWVDLRDDAVAMGREGDGLHLGQ